MNNNTITTSNQTNHKHPLSREYLELRALMKDLDETKKLPSCPRRDKLILEMNIYLGIYTRIENSKPKPIQSKSTDVDYRLSECDRQRLSKLELEVERLDYILCNLRKFLNILKNDDSLFNSKRKFADEVITKIESLESEGYNLLRSGEESSFSSTHHENGD